MTPEQREAEGKVVRSGYVLAIYRWLIEVAFLFAAFNEYPAHKWSIGLGLLCFTAAISAIGSSNIAQLVALQIRLDHGDRKTRHAVIHAAEWVAGGGRHIEPEDFWPNVERRVEREFSSAAEYADKPTGFWKGSALAFGALAWQLASSLFGIALVAALTSSSY